MRRSGTGNFGTEVLLYLTLMLFVKFIIVPSARQSVRFGFAGDSISPFSMWNRNLLCSSIVLAEFQLFVLGFGNAGGDLWLLVLTTPLSPRISRLPNIRGRAIPRVAFGLIKSSKFYTIFILLFENDYLSCNYDYDLKV